MPFFFSPFLCIARLSFAYLCAVCVLGALLCTFAFALCSLIICKLLSL